MEKRRDRLHGRRKGKKLSPRREGLMASLFPTLALDLSAAPPKHLPEIFPAAVSEVRLEIGFGGGERLLAGAAASPLVGFIGVEPFINGMAKVVAGVADAGLRNVRLFGGDAALLLEWLPPGQLTEIDLLYPDPWPKKRHWKRRFVSEENLDRIARVLQPGGIFRFASDIGSYVEWTLVHLSTRKDFVWTAERADDWRRPIPGWLKTRYEAKATAAGRRPTYLAFTRH